MPRRRFHVSGDVVTAAFGPGQVQSFKFKAPSSRPQTLNLELGTLNSFSKSDLLDHADPVVGVESARGEVRDHVEDLIREAADVEDVLAFGRLRRAVGLHVNADQARAPVAALEDRPLAHRRRAAATSGVYPRLVVR